MLPTEVTVTGSQPFQALRRRHAPRILHLGGALVAFAIESAVGRRQSLGGTGLLRTLTRANIRLMPVIVPGRRCFVSRIVYIVFR